MRVLTLDKNFLFNIVLGFMFFITVPVFAALGEARLDLYVSMFTLEYFVAYAILRPRRKIRDPIAPTLFIVFMFIVAGRVMEVLMK